MKKTIFASLIMILLILSGCGHKSKDELIDIEQFKCQDSIQTVFDVLGEKDILKSEYSDGEYYEYEDLNLWGYNGNAIFRVRDDKETIKSFYCNLQLNKKEFEKVFSQLSTKYGEYEKKEYTNLTSYIWEVSEDKAEEIGYSRISLSYNGDKKTTVDFSDEWSIYKDEAYYEHLKEENKEEVNVIFHKDYEVDGEKVTISLNETEDDLEVSVLGKSKTEEKASLMLTIISSDMKEISHSVSVLCGDLYMITTNDGTVFGINRDGSVSFSAPDWYGIPDEEDVTEELKDYMKSVKEMEKDFLEEMQDSIEK